MSKNLDPDQARHFVGPDLGPNCLQRLQAGKEINNTTPINSQWLQCLKKEHFRDAFDANFLHFLSDYILLT